MFNKIERKFEESQKNLEKIIIILIAFTLIIFGSIGIAIVSALNTYFSCLDYEKLNGVETYYSINENKCYNLETKQEIKL